MWGLGMYVNDDWHVKPNLKITLGFRVERNSNPVCQFNCFANFKGQFSSLASVTSSNPGSVPYSNDISYGQHQAFPGVDAANLSPRIGFSWSPGHDQKTVISGGFRIFYDAPAAGLVDDLLTNPPVSVGIRVRPAAGVLALRPCRWSGDLAGLRQCVQHQQDFRADLVGADGPGSGVRRARPSPRIVGTVHAPMWHEWNFQIQRQLTPSVVFSANYVGNHGSRIPYGSHGPTPSTSTGCTPA